jgi:hypothetical protein
MIRGHMDALTSGGFAEGWAFDSKAPERILTLRLLGPDDDELALGLANLYRADLAEARYRHGWCAFRLRLSRDPASLLGQRLSLREAASGKELHATDDPPVRDRPALDTCDSIEAAIAQDPTVLRNLQHLSGCGDLLAGFVARRGVAEFVRTAHAYVLGRSADGASQARHERLLKSGAVTPFGILLILAETEEFRAQPRLLASPADPGFVFAA